MTEVYTVQRRPLSPQEAEVRPDIPHGLVRVLGAPEVGMSLVLVGKEGVVQTSVVRRLERSSEELVVETDHSQYTLRIAA